jgi:hypothetical protein
MKLKKIQMECSKGSKTETSSPAKGKGKMAKKEYEGPCSSSEKIT